jgi:4-hydroxy-3-methylbut-2-en-1-yl diphosphate reductase
LIAVEWYSPGAVRALLVKMGLSAYSALARRWSSVTATGRCEPRRAFLVMCRGERSREARCDDPPSSGPCRFWVVSDTSGVLLASPRGYCAGVERAVETVEKALDLYGPPVYVRKQIVHNLHVVRDLEARGAVFVDEETEVPEGATVVFSAHGVAPAVHANAAARQLQTIDATCPLVTKVHVQARRYAAEGYTVVLIGHAGHEEVVGTMGEAPGAIVLVESVADVDRLELGTARVAYVTQTTLSVDETGEIITALRARFPEIHAPKREDICYATSNRQWAVKEMLSEIDLLLVIGSRNSSNSNRLVEVARAGGVGAYLIDDESEIDETWMDSVEVVGVTSGASAPEKLVEGVCEWFRARGVDDIEAYRLVDEDVEFRLPVELRRELALADAQR